MNEKNWEEHCDRLQSLADNTIYRYLSDQELELITNHMSEMNGNICEQDVVNIIFHVTKNNEEDCYGE